MTLEKLTKANKLLTKIEEKEMSIKCLKYGCAESVVERDMVIQFNGYSGLAEMDKRYFKNLCNMMLSFSINDLAELQKEFDEL